MTQFPSPQFSLAMHLLPGPVAMGMRKPPEGAPPVAESELHEAVHKLRELNAHLEAARYAKFWATFDSDDLYADLTADVSGFEELMRVRIAQLVGQAYREVGLDKLELWLGIRGGEAETRRFVEGTCKWTVRDAKDGEESPVAIVPLNPDNEAKKAEIREDVSFDMFSRVVRRSWEEQAL